VIPTLHTDRLVLRSWRPDDERDVAAAYDTYRRPEVVRWLGSTPTPDTSIDDTRARLARWAAVDASESPGLGRWAVTLPADDVPIGCVILRHLPDADEVPTDDVEVGWHLHPDHWGHGYATEAAAALIRHGFGTLGLEEIHAVAWAGNDPSFAVMERLGMTPQGPTDRWYGVTLEWWRISRAPARRPAATRSTS
jgi:RimJ/RimL family protein N-acetyltransferase